jgi:putative ABC transport system permease protein
MLTPRQILRRLRDLGRGRRLDHDVDDEIRFHIEMQTRALIAKGMPAGRARAKAESDFGAVARITDHVRVARGLSASNLIDDLTRDLRFAARSLLRSPAFAVMSILTLALGIGATTAMFSVVNGVLLSALPYPHAERLVMIRERSEHEGKPITSDVSAPNFADWRAQTKALDLMVAMRGGETTVLGLDEPIKANLYAVSHDYFALFGGAPLLGRVFASDESKPGGAPVAVVSERFWRDRLGARRDIASLHLQAWGLTVQVIGVMPAGFGYPNDAQVWIPIEPLNTTMGRDSHNDDVLGRLAPGATVASAEVDLTGVAKRLRIAFPEHNEALGAKVTSLRDSLVGPVRTYLELLFGAVVMVLLVACVNLASANLARGAGRARELSIRSVLGAGRGRLARQLLTESLLVALVGGTTGLLVARWLVRGMLALSTRPLPRASEIDVSVPVMLFTLLLTVATGVLIGVLPALQVGRSDLRSGVTAGGRGTAVGRSGMRRALVTAEVALALLLLVGAGLLARSFRVLMNQNAGFTADGMLAIRVSLPETRYSTGDRIASHYTSALAALRSLPGVESASFINIAPLTRGGFGGGMGVEDRPGEKAVYSDYRVVSPEYFRTAGIPLVAGRMFTTADDSSAPHVVLINQTMAKRYWPGENPIGKRLIEYGMDKHRDKPMTVIGIVGDVRSADLATEPSPQHFVPYRQRPERATFGVLLLRTTLPPTSLAQTARSQLRVIDANVLTQAEPYTDIRARSLGDRRFVMTVLGGFALLALLLAAIGIYGVLSYAVAQRTREIGVRMALGAARMRVVGMVLQDSLAPVVLGSAIGVAGAIACTRVMGAMLYGISATDPLTFVAVVAVLLAVAVIASVVPAARAARVDPIVALREE